MLHQESSAPAEDGCSQLSDSGLGVLLCCVIGILGVKSTVVSMHPVCTHCSISALV